MPLVPTGELVTEAAAAGRAVAAFNVVTLEHAEAVATAAEEAGLPAVLQISQNAVAYHGHRLGPIAAATGAVARCSTAPLALHLDHADSWELVEAAPAEGFGSVMYDASRLNAEENLRRTAEAVRFSHAHGLWVEAELGRIGGKPGEPPLDAHTPGVRTDPAEAAAYVKETGVDALAVAVGSSHAMTERTAALDHTLITALRSAVPVPLVLHGSSGVPDEELAHAVRSGMTKINIGTALNQAFTSALTTHLTDHPDPRPYLSLARAAVRGRAHHFLTVLSGV